MAGSSLNALFGRSLLGSILRISHHEIFGNGEGRSAANAEDLFATKSRLTLSDHIGDCAYRLILQPRTECAKSNNRHKPVKSIDIHELRKTAALGSAPKLAASLSIYPVAQQLIWRSAR
jgi:hypothetical protein